MIEQLFSDLRRDEGEVLHAYQDSLGYWTIGVGRLIDKRLGGGITRAEATFLLGNDVSKVIQDLDRELPWWRTLSENRQRALLNMCFNLGIGDADTGKGLLGFRNTLAAVKRGDWSAAAAGMLQSRWAMQVGARATRLAAIMKGG